MPEFQYDDAAHRYALDGVILPSVTQVLRGVGIIDNSWYTPKARKRGKAVHAATHYDDEGDLEETSLAPQYIGYLQGWRRFRLESNFFPELIEVPRYHPRYRYAGKPDRTGVLGNGKVLLDIKTGAIEVWTALQTAAYTDLFEKPLSFRRITIQLRPDGSYSLKEFSAGDYRRDLAAFLAALTVHNWKSNHTRNI